jgi:hypothetical protein
MMFKTYVFPSEGIHAAYLNWKLQQHKGIQLNGKMQLGNKLILDSHFFIIS